MQSRDVRASPTNLYLQSKQTLKKAKENPAVPIRVWNLRAMQKSQEKVPVLWSPCAARQGG